MVDKDIPETKPAEKPAPKIYKGVNKKVAELKDLPLGEVLQATTREIPSSFGGSYKLPRLVVLNSIQDTNRSDTKKLTFFDGRKTGNFAKSEVQVPSDFEIRHLSGTVSKAIAERFATWRESNLYKQELTKYGMTLGFDPEIFVEDKDGKVVPAFEFLGSKEKPDKTQVHHSGNQNVYWDGFQAEFETPANFTCLGYVSDAVHLGLKRVSQLAKQYKKGAKLSPQVVVKIPDELRLTAKEEHVQFGCAPSFNVYGLKGNTNDGRSVPYRFAGGHIHFGINSYLPSKLNQNQIDEIVKSLDALIALPCVSLLEKFDDPIRREYYGLPGEYRLPAHGIEYRTLSNAYIFHPAIMNLVTDYARKALWFGYSGFRSHIEGYSEQEIVDIILCSDVKRAREFMEKNKKIIMRVINSAYPYIDAGEVGYNVLFRGMHEIVENPSDIEGNWNISNGAWLNHCAAKWKNWSNAMPAIKAGNKI